MLKERGVVIEDITMDFYDGVLWVCLVEVLSGKRLTGTCKKPRMRIQKIQNMAVVLEFLKTEGFVVDRWLSAGDLVDCNLKILLGLLWTLILRYQMNGGKPSNSTKTELLEFVREKLPQHNISAFHNWKVAYLYDLVEAIEPGCLPTQPESESEACKSAMEVANTLMEIPMLLDPEDMIESCDELSTMLYISYFRDYERQLQTRIALKAGNTKSANK